LHTSIRRWFSSVAYFFAREIYNKTKIPIGLIHTSWGGTIAEAWTSGPTLKTMPDFAEAVKGIENAASVTDKQTEQQKMEQWQKSIFEKDSGYNNGQAQWAMTNTNAGDWQNMTLPTLWESASLAGI
jgi:sialate O-acetylesterase